MAQTISRGQLNSLSSALSGGSVPSALVIRDVPDFIPHVRRNDRPMISLVPRKGSRDKLVWEYGEGDYAPKQDALGADLTTGTSSVTVADGDAFQKWDLIKIGDEVMLVTAVSTNTLTVTRGWGSTSDPGTTYASGTEIRILGPAVPEGVDSPESPVTFGEVFETYPQELHYTWELTHRARATPNYQFKNDAFKARLKEKMDEAGEDLDILLLDGIKNKGDGSKTNPSSMGGLREHTNIYTLDANGDPIQLIDVLELLQDVASDVGQSAMGKTVMGGYFMKRVFNSFFQPARRASMSDKKMKLTWDEVETDFGVLKFVTNYRMTGGELIIWNPQDSGLYNYKDGNWETGVYETQGWFTKGYLRGDFGAIFEGARRRCRIYGCSTSAADYPNLDVAA